jgi:hypothetical protein
VAHSKLTSTRFGEGCFLCKQDTNGNLTAGLGIRLLQPDSKKYQPFQGEPCQLIYVPPSPILPCRHVSRIRVHDFPFLLPSLSVLESVSSWPLAGNQDGSFSDTDQARRNARLSYALQPSAHFVHLSHPHFLRSSSDTGYRTGSSRPDLPSR